MAFQLAEQRCASCVFGSWWCVVDGGMIGGIYTVMWHFSWPNRGVFGSWWCVVGGGMIGGIYTVMWHFSWPNRGVLLVCLGHGGV